MNNKNTRYWPQDMTSLLQFTINIRKSHCQPNLTLQLVFEDRVLFVSVDLHLSLCWQQHTKSEQAIRLVYPPFVCKLRSSSSPTNKSIKEFGLGIQTALFRHSFRIRHMFIRTFFPHNTDIVTS